MKYKDIRVGDIHDGLSVDATTLKERSSASKIVGVTPGNGKIIIIKEDGSWTVGLFNEDVPDGDILR